MSDLDNKLIIEAMSRRGFLGTLGKAAAVAGINPKLPIPNLRDDDDDYDDDEYDDEGDWGDEEGFDVYDWINSNVLDHTVDKAIGNTKISKELANEIWKQLISNMDERAGDSFTVELKTMFDDLMVREISQGKRFYEVTEDPEFLELAISDLSKMINDDLKLPQLIAKAAAREQRGDKQEDILKDVKADLEDPNRIEYSKFDIAGGKRDYEYTADSFIMSNKDNIVPLLETFDSSYTVSYGEDHDPPHEYVYTFRAYRWSYVVRFDNNKIGYYSFEFFLRGSDHGGYSVTGTGNEFKVFSTVVKIVKIFLNELKRDGVEFKRIKFQATKTEPSRIKLYEKLVKTLTKKYNLSYEIIKNLPGNVYFYLIPISFKNEYEKL